MGVGRGEGYGEERILSHRWSYRPAVSRSQDAEILDDIRGSGGTTKLPLDNDFYSPPVFGGHRTAQAQHSPPENPGTPGNRWKIEMHNSVVQRNLFHSVVHACKFATSNPNTRTRTSWPCVIQLVNLGAETGAVMGALLRWRVLCINTLSNSWGERPWGFDPGRHVADWVKNGGAPPDGRSAAVQTH